MRRFGRFNAVEMVKGYAMPSDEGGVDYGQFHGGQRLAAFAGYDGGPGIPGPAGRAGRGVPAYVTQTIPALSGYRGFGLMMDPPLNMTTQQDPIPTVKPPTIGALREREGKNLSVVPSQSPPVVTPMCPAKHYYDPSAGVCRSMCPAKHYYDPSAGVCRSEGLGTAAKVGLMVGLGVLVAYVMG